MPDAGLTAALKQAKGKKMFFAFVPKGGSDGHLIVSKAKIPPKQIADAKKEIGGGNAVTGKCFGGDGGAMVFQVAKAAPAGMAAAVKKVAKRDTGLTIDPDFQLAGDADAEEQDVGTAAGTAAPATASASPPAAPAQGNVLGIQKALQKLGFDPGKIDGVNGAHTQAAIKKFQHANGLAADGIAGPKTQAALAKALQGRADPRGEAQNQKKDGSGGVEPAGQVAGAVGAVSGLGGEIAKAISGARAVPAPQQFELPPIDAERLGLSKSGRDDWSAARQNVISDLKLLAAKVAGTKHGRAVGVLKDINAIIKRLPAEPAASELDNLEDFIRNDDTITAAEEVPAHFHDLNIREPLLKALEAMKS